MYEVALPIARTISEQKNTTRDINSSSDNAVQLRIAANEVSAASNSFSASGASVFKDDPQLERAIRWLARFRKTKLRLLDRSLTTVWFARS